MYSAIGDGDNLSSSVSVQLNFLWEIQPKLIIRKGRSGKVYTGSTEPGTLDGLLKWEIEFWAMSSMTTFVASP
ncbi:hypothetical protein L1887_38359 [Cichorium endivia]|nr:hypothetical protein L1887_38359 [Cichorium endivia]